MRTLELHHVNPVELLKRSVRAFLDDDMPTYAAALSYSALFALFPFLIFLIALLGFLHIPDFFDWLLEQAQPAMPSDSYSLVESVIRDIQGKSRGGLLSVGILIAIWSASSGHHVPHGEAGGKSSGPPFR